MDYLFRRRLGKNEYVTPQLAGEMAGLSQEIQREISIIFSRDGKVLDINISKKGEAGNIFSAFLPQEKDYYSRRRIVKTSFSEKITERDILLLNRLRLDCLVVISGLEGRLKWTAVVRTPPGSDEPLRFIELDGREISDFAALIESYEEELRRFREGRSKNRDEKRALIVGCGPETESDIEFYVEEMKNLLATLNICAAESVWQKRIPESAYLVGRGKLGEIMQRARLLECDMIVFYNTLTPVQKRNIEDETGIRVCDRNQIILDIFAKRAKSNEGKIQIELAYLKYQLPRLTEKDAGLSRLVGGFRTKGPGETKLEVMRRRFREKISFLNKKIEELRQRRDFTREKRKSSKIPMISIAGYTNAGKSTLLNRITRSSVYVENKLFATLDPATRRYTFADGFPVLFSDTVGFIKNLPEELKSAFMATFEEITVSDLILHVADISSKDVYNHIEAVEEILSELGCDHIPRILILNKADKIKRSEIQFKRSDGIFISAATGEGLDLLMQRIREYLGK